VYLTTKENLKPEELSLLKKSKRHLASKSIQLEKNNRYLLESLKFPYPKPFSTEHPSEKLNPSYLNY
jgi:cell shape-determining protein MreC